MSCPQHDVISEMPRYHLGTPLSVQSEMLGGVVLNVQVNLSDVVMDTGSVNCRVAAAERHTVHQVLISDEMSVTTRYIIRKMTKNIYSLLVQSFVSTPPYINPYNAEIFLYKRWSPKGLFTI